MNYVVVQYTVHRCVECVGTRVYSLSTLVLLLVVQIDQVDKGRMAMQAAGAGAGAGTRLVAIHTFSGEADHDLPFKKGDVLFGERLDGSWWTGTNEAGQRGSFPMNYVKEEPSSSSATQAPPVANSGAGGAPQNRAAPSRSAARPVPVGNSVGDQYGALPGGPAEVGPPSPSAPGGPGAGAGTDAAQVQISTEMTREGTVLLIRGLQFVTSLFAFSFLGSANSAPVSIAIAGVSVTTGTSSGVKFVLAMAVIGWIWSICTCAVTFGIMHDRAPEWVVSHPKRHVATLATDVFIFSLSLLALTLCPTDFYSFDGRIVAGALIHAIFSFLLVISTLMSYKDMIKQKLVEQGWQPPPGYDLTHGRTGATPIAAAGNNL